MTRAPTTKPTPPSRAAPAAKAATAPAKPRARVGIGEIPTGQGQRIGLFGPGGIGKTTMAAMLAVADERPAACFDLDDSLPIIGPALAAAGYPGKLQVVNGIETWQQIRDALQAAGWDDVGTIVIDSATRAEELAVAHTLATVKNERDQFVQRIEAYGYGKGYQYVYETFLTLLGDLDAHVRAGRNVVLIMHDCTTTVPNPKGDDWLRYEPRLQSPNSGKASIRLRVREWLDHLLFLGYDVEAKDGIGENKQSSRTIYPTEQPHCMAKSRILRDTAQLVEFDTAVWNALLGKTE